MIPKKVLPALTLLALVGACHPQGAPLHGGNGVLVAPGSVDFGNIYQGAQRQFTVTLANNGDAALNLSLVLGGNPQFSLVSANTLSLLGGDHQDLTLLLTASQLGTVAGTLQISGDTTATIALNATVIANLVCTPPGPCLLSHFDPNQGQCIENPVADNQPCDDGDPCTTNKACQGGLCKGVPASCEDNDVCTVDFCQPNVGCQHLDESAHCNGNDPCQIYYCDSKTGCQSAPASDFTPCDAVIPCQVAHWCIGGQCTGVHLPDGIPCVSPIDPCAKDGTCQNGACYSPIAAALKPGDVLWQVVSAAFSDGDGGSTWDAGDAGAGLSSVQTCDDAGYCVATPAFRSAATVDGDGNFYIDDSLTDGGIFLVSYDVCGNERWHDYASRSSIQWTNGRHVLSSSVLFTVAENPQTIIGQSPVTGNHLWEFDPQAPLGMNSSNFLIKDVALGNDGVLYYAADWQTPIASGMTYGRMLGGVLRNGQSKFQVVLPSLPYTSQSPYNFGYPLLADENENLYTAMDIGYSGAEVESYDQTGTLRFTISVPRYSLNSFSENQGFFLEPVSLTAFDSQGKLVWSLNDPTKESNGHSPVVATDDHLSILRHTLDTNPTSELDNFDPLGNLVWSYQAGPLDRGIGGDAESSVVLDQQGILYFLEGNQIHAVRESDGSPVFKTKLATLAPAYQGVLSLTPAGSLVASVSERLFGIFVGSPMSNAPWPRFRGDNANRSSPPPSPGGVFP